jgi:hypothetical protein
LFNPEFYHLSCNPSEALATWTMVRAYLICEFSFLLPFGVWFFFFHPCLHNFFSELVL